MARVLAYVPDLLFGSNVLGGLRGAGHEVELVATLGAVDPAVEVLVVDLTADVAERIAAVEGATPGTVRTLGFYAHVERDVRERAERAGFDLVVPRSRMAREGPVLVSRLAAGT